MIEKIKHSVSSLINIGVHSKLSADIATKVRMINATALIGVAINFIFISLSLFVYSAQPKVLNLIFIVIFVELLVIILNAIFPPKITFYYIIFSLTLLFTGLKIFYVNNWGEQFVFLIIIYLVFLLFNSRKKQFFLVFAIVSCYIIAEIAHQWLPDEMIMSLFQTKDSRVYLFTTYVIWLTFLINLFHQRTVKASDEQEALLTELQQKNKAIQAVSNEVERFNHIASHDLKSPLRNIISFVGLIKIKLNRQQYDEIPEQLDFIENAAAQMNLLVDDIMTFSKVNGSDYSTTGVDLNHLAHEIASELESFLQEKNGKIIFNNLPTIHINYEIFKIVFQHLIKNAIQYNTSTQPTVTITHHSDDQYHTFKFVDNGIGISKEFQKQVFEYFKRLHTYQTYRGSGLGLGICKKIIENMNGKLLLSSEIGQGSVFRIQLPISISVKQA